MVEVKRFESKIRGGGGCCEERKNTCTSYKSKIHPSFLLSHPRKEKEKEIERGEEGSSEKRFGNEMDTEDEFPTETSVLRRQQQRETPQAKIFQFGRERKKRKRKEKEKIHYWIKVAISLRKPESKRRVEIDMQTKTSERVTDFPYRFLAEEK